MRVVTHLGFGEVENLDEQHISVLLDEAFLGQNPMTLSKEEVFLFSDWAIVKVLNITAHGWFSNLQFYPSKESAEAQLSKPSPPDETTFFLDLESGRFTCNRQLGLLVKGPLWIQPWIDRWTEEQSTPFTYIHEALTAFQMAKESLAGSMGIQASALLEREGGGTVLAFYVAIAPPQGVIFEKEFKLQFYQEA